MHNLSLLSAAEKNRIELDKQAAYAVWQLKNGKAGPEVFLNQAQSISDDDERAFYEKAVEKYKNQMGIV
ncbi:MULTISPECIES: DUF3283 family protein [Photobacterium]|uniref:Pyridoxamine 5-phosphate oxidase n=1 Tax=Photobacterium halotolerans TaxID=265726 RepID=A0A0F5V7B7_9GAMM|nr:MULTISPECIES: DUF3283 family protein [Photobacterium]KKC98060.1 pyridoxamine 5-phosphate oxidase [Photobacterium halotolerans]UIP30261.1 DUF3283 family protein [Photobacterium sp. TLY01]